MENGSQYIYGRSISAIAANFYSVYPSLVQNICNIVSESFNQDNGFSLFQSMEADNNFQNTQGLDKTSFYYNQVQNNYRNLLSSQYPILSTFQVDIYSSIINSIVFAYYISPAISITGLQNYIDLTLKNATEITNIDPFYQGYQFISPISTGQIINAVNNYGYNFVYQELQANPKNNDIELVNINFYNVTGLFSQPNLQLMQDAENQYYAISGELIYNNLLTGIPNCNYSEVQISTSTGNKTITYITNAPCQEQKSSIGPVNGIVFYRVFNDGPYSSGNFTQEIENEFIQFDQNVLTSNDYSSNAKSLYSFYIDASGNYIPLLINTGTTFIDANGEIDLNREYLYTPQTECGYQLMRIGGNNPRCLVTGFDGVHNLYGIVAATGFKFVNLQLNNTWNNSFNKCLTNPISSTNRMLIRALDIQSNPYLATSSGNSLLPYYTIDEFGDIEWYVGPPQLNGTNTLPYLAFFQNFNSNTFNQKANLTLYAALGQANGDINDDNRSWSISFNQLSSGQDNNNYTYNVTNGYPQVKFQVTIPSSAGSGDSIFAQVFGMGDFFSGQYNVTQTYEQNAGYFYTGYLFSGQNGITDINYNYIINNYSQYILGSQIKNFNYINGYNGTNNLNLSLMYSQDNSGNLYSYYYFDNNYNPINIQQTGWISGFAQLPISNGISIDNQTGYNRVYNTSTVENSLIPRFSNGPYAITNKKFLYPNASGVSLLYNSQLNGFPSKINFTLKIREETVKEIYANYTISNGIFNPNPNYVNIIRPQTFGYNLGVLQNIFDGPQGNILYDFNVWAVNYGFNAYTGINLINNNWGLVTDDPNRPTYIPSGRNNTLYVNSPIFNQGILYTGYSISDYNTWFYTYNDPEILSSGYNILVRGDPGFGLYHNYTGYVITGQLIYTKPIYDLHSGMLNPYFSLNVMPFMNYTPFIPSDDFNEHIDPFPLNTCIGNSCVGLLGDIVSYMNGIVSYAISGQDPIFYKFIGGRLGSYLSQLQGGYHPEGIIGDEWLNLSYNNIGSEFTPFQCDGSDLAVRVPNSDNQVILISSTQTGTKIFTRALNFNPMAFNYNVLNQFYSGYNINPSKPITTIFDTGYNGIGFDLGKIFPLKFNNLPGYYNSSGLTIGPFDRDIELYSYIPITGITQIILNGNVLSDYYSCQYSWCLNQIPSTIGGGQISKYNLNPYYPPYTYGGIDPIIIIPSGTPINLNVYANAECSQANGDIYQTGIGVLTGTYLYIRSRRALKECDVDTNLQDSNDWSNFQFDVNGMEQEFFIPNNKFESLNGINNTFITFSRTGILYPQPDPVLFTGMGTLDKNRNPTFPNVQQYWKNITLKSGITIYASGWREGSRISFTFENVNVEYDCIPYQTQSIVIPSGSCTITGSMYYCGQADNSIFSQGISLIDNSPQLNLITGFYSPFYISPILNRIPNFSYPSGQPNSRPVLDAPSQMIQRNYSLLIQDNQSYTLLENYAPNFFNCYNWVAQSDLFVLNNSETIEETNPPQDGNTYLNSLMTISASQGQKLSDDTTNPSLFKIYDVNYISQFYDSIATDSIINSGYFLTHQRGSKVRLEQSIDCPSGHLAPKGTSIYQIQNGLV